MFAEGLVKNGPKLKAWFTKRGNKKMADEMKELTNKAKKELGEIGESTGKTLNETLDYSAKHAKRVARSTDKVTKQISEFEQKISNFDYEDGLLVNNAKNYRVEYFGKKFSNKMDWTNTPDMYFIKSTLTHNHPSGSGLSLADVKTFINTGLREIRAVTKNGSVYAMKTDGISKKLKNNLLEIIEEQESIARGVFSETDSYFKDAFVFKQVWDAMKDVVEYVHYID